MTASASRKVGASSRAAAGAIDDVDGYSATLGAAAGPATAVALPAASVDASRALSGAAASLAFDLNPATPGAEPGHDAAPVAPDAVAGETSREDPSEEAPYERKRLRAYLSGDGDLARRISAFNRYPTRYLHPSWIPSGWDPAWLERHRDGGRAEARLGEAVLRHWKLDAKPCFDFDRPAHRLALVDREPLERLAYLAGLARHADAISRTLERDKVLELRRQLGEEGYRFAAFRAPLLAGSLGAAAAGVPAVGPWPVRAMAAGLRMLAECLSGAPAGLVSRAALKLPRKDAHLLVSRGGFSPVEAYARLFRRILVKEIDPAWDSLLS